MPSSNPSNDLSSHGPTLLRVAVDGTWAARRSSALAPA